MMKTASKKTLNIIAVIAAFSAATAFAVPNFSDYPLSTTGQAGVQPNIMFTLDDSGSMDSDYLPDWSTFYTDYSGTNLKRYDSPVAEQDLFRNPGYNGVAYNPAIRYLPPYFLGDTTTYPSMTGTSAATGADTAYALPNWRAVPADKYGVQVLANASYNAHGLDSTCPDGTFNRTTCNLQAINTSVTPNVPYAFSYQFQAGEYCTDTHQTDCVVQFGPTTARPVASVLRWCTSQTNQTDCQALFDDTGTLPGGKIYKYPRAAGKATGSTYKALITVSTCSACSVTSVTINGTAYPLPAATDAAQITTVTGISSASALASKLYDVLPKAIPGLGVSNLSGSTFYIYLPVASAPTWSMSATGATFSFGGWTTATTNIVGSNSPTYITSAVDSYPRAAARSDCDPTHPLTATHCTYVEEMTNYANWLAYYRTRLQMMKTSVSNAFQVIDDHYRVGYFTISQNLFLNPNGFNPANKQVWYNYLFATPVMNATPLRGAISRIGQFYAGTHSGETWGILNDSNKHIQPWSVVDPLQYQCQKNFDILATDGYWNSSDEVTGSATTTYGPYDVTNTVKVGQQDGGPGTSPGTSPWVADFGQEMRPQYDGQHQVFTKTVTQTLQTDTQLTRTDAWSEKTTAGYQQKTWNLNFKVSTWGYTQHTVSYTQQDTPYTFTKVTTPYIWQQVVTPYTWDVISTPIIWKEVDTTYNYKVTTTPIVWKDVQTPYTYDKVTTPYTWTQKDTLYTWTKVVYTGVPAYAYVKDGVSYSGQSYCPLTPASQCTVSYPTYTSATSTNQTSCSASGSIGNATYTTCSLVAGTPSSTPGKTSCTTAPTPTTYGTKTDCTLIAGSLSTLHSQTSCSVAATPVTYGNKVDCTPVSGTSSTTYHGGSCSNVSAPTSAGGTANTAVACSLVADPNNPASSQDNQNSCTPTGTLSAPGNQITCAAGTGSGVTNTTYPASCTNVTVPAPTSAGGTGGINKSCSLVASTPVTTQHNQSTCTQTGTLSAPGTQITCTAVPGAQVTTNPATCTAGNTTTSTGYTNTQCNLVIDTPNVQSVSGQSTCTPAPIPTTGPGSAITCTPNAGTSSAATTVASCTTVPAPTTAGSATAVTARSCTNLNIPDTNITTACPASTATQAISCGSLKSVATLSNQSLCQDANGNTGSGSSIVAGSTPPTGTSPGQVTCGATYVLQGTSPYWVASAATPSTSTTGSTYTSTPTYGSGAGKSTAATVIGTSAYVSSTAAVGPSACTTSGTGVFPAITCNAVSNVTHPSSCTAASYTVNSYTTGGVTVTAGTGSTTCASATTQTNQPVDPASCDPVNHVLIDTYGTPKYNASTGKTTTCTLTQTVTSGLAPSACPQNLPPNNGNNWTTTTCTPGLAGGSSNSLADVTDYYYRTDLRPATGGHCNDLLIPTATSNNVCINKTVTPNEDTRQNMVTYTLGLGVSGQMFYSPTYPEDLSGDYYDIAQGNASTTSKCRWNTVGESCSWPIPVENKVTTVDDLWHAAVDGRGKYFSAGDPTTLGQSLSGALSGIAIKVGAGSAAATSNLQPVQGDNFAYVASFETETWVGDLQARTIDLVTGAVSNGLDSNGHSTCGSTGGGCLWSAQTTLDLQNGTLGGKNTTTSPPTSIATSASRSIYLEPYPGGTTMRSFNFAAISQHSDESAYFTNGISNEVDLNYLVSGSTTLANVATNLIDYLAGSRAFEGHGFRVRTHILGDIVDSAPVFVGKPTFSYGDTGYAAFKTAKAARKGVVYALANDGMLHAFDSATGMENWAFVPRAVLPRMYALAKTSYSHTNYLDGKISVGDAYFQGASEPTPSWHTVLIAGYGKGGSGYFALDITDPTAPPTFLWSVDANTSGFGNLGYSYGNAAITKLPHGDWVALFSSGYNNADGHGYLYAVNISTGAMKSGFPLSTSGTSISDGGTAADPSNLGQISTWVDIPNKDNSAYFVYAGDFHGNVWRFDLGTSLTTTATVDPCTGVGSIHNCTTGAAVFKLAILKDSSGVVQPITTHIETTTHDAKYRLVFVSTGSYLTTTDATVTQTQSTYAIKDALENLGSNPSAQSTFDPLRDLTTSGANPGPLFIKRYLVGDTFGGVSVRVACATANCSPAVTTMNWGTNAGWYIDYLEAGERVNIDQILALGTLIVPSNVPASNACQSGGHAWINYFDYASGLSIISNVIGVTTKVGVTSQQIATALAVGVSVIQLPDNSVEAIVTTSDYKNVTVSPTFAPAPFQNRLDSWRDIEPF